MGFKSVPEINISNIEAFSFETLTQTWEMGHVHKSLDLPCISPLYFELQSKL